jgi:hypothetical protein
MQAGAGGSSSLTGGLGVGGAGGSITKITGFVSSGDGGDPFTTSFEAGPGGNGVSRAGAGGSIDIMDFYGGGGANVTFFVNAGDAGNATSAKTGATGGSVTDIGAGVESDTNLESATISTAAFSISTLTDFHHISAGNGGNAVAKGGLGGSVKDVFVNAAIGYRYGVTFGFDLGVLDSGASTGAGGISVGAGGTGAVAGLAGNVEDVTADAIASIVAGHLGAGGLTGSGGSFTGDALNAVNLADKVDGIILNGTAAPSTVQDFNLSFNGDTTVGVPSNATPIEVANALNALTSIQNAGGVYVTATTGGGYAINFNNAGGDYSGGNLMPITGVEPAPQYTTEITKGNIATSTSEVQQLQVLAPDSFNLTFDGQTTGTIPAAGSVSAATEAMNIQSALNGLSSTPNVTVTPVTGTVNPTFTITFPSTSGPEPLVTPNYIITLTPTGTATTVDTQTITFPTRGDLVPAQLATANFVGSIFNPLRLNATTFQFTGSSSSFQFGDTPIDGLIAATDLTAYKNFIPEAYITESNGAALLVDNTIS